MKTYKNGYVIAILLMLLMVLYVTSSFYTGIASSTVHAVWTAALDRGIPEQNIKIFVNDSSFIFLSTIAKRVKILHVSDVLDG